MSRPFAYPLKLDQIGQGMRVDLNPDALRGWQEVARNTAWKDFAARNSNCAKLMALAEQSIAAI